MRDMWQQDKLVNALSRYTNAISVALGYRDNATRLHSDRVCQLSDAIGSHCKLSARELGILHISAALHDVGKIGVPDAVLSKPGMLDQAERGVMQRHSPIGQDIVLATGIDGADEAARIIRHHHEHFDGKGYPDQLAGEAIPIASRIIAIADSYDAMAVTRPYHKPRSHTEIMGVLAAESGNKHDPELLRIFSSLIEESRFRAQ